MPRRAEWIGLAAAVLLFAAIAGLGPANGWCSSDWQFRRQTDAMLRGTFALQPLPYRQRADWAWGAGSQQVWGLGVPLLRLPFEAVARATGADGFPDRLVFVLLFAAVALAMYVALADDAPFTRGVVTAVTMFFPPFLMLCRTRFAVYEEPAAYGFLWSVLLLALLVAFDRRGRTFVLAALAAASGFAVIIRPTLLFYGLVTVLLAAWSARRHRAGAAAIAGGAALFAAGPLAALATNWQRFGDPFEFGQRVNVSRYTLDQLAKNFGYPFAHEPVVSAVRELIGALFFADHSNGNDFYGSGLYAWQSPTFRFREFYFSTFDAVMLAALAGAWGLAVWSRRRHRTAWIVTLWSIASFAAQFVFYVRMPSATSRYAIDFAPAVAAAFAAALLILGGDAERQPDASARAWTRATIVAAALLFIVSEITTGWVSPTHAARPLVTLAEVRRLMPAPALEGPPVPSEYRCGDDLSRVGIPFNGIGWASTGDCRVEAATTFYMRGEGCLSIQGEGDVGAVQAKFGATFLQRREPLVFCPPRGFRPNPTGIEIVSVAWMPPDAASTSARPFRLEIIRKAP